MTLDSSRVADDLEKARAFADAIEARAELDGRLATLAGYGAPLRTRCTLGADLSPHSFSFVMEVESSDGEWRAWFDGALVYHGPLDVRRALTASERGWSIHT